MTDYKISVKTIREMVEALKAVEIKGPIKLPLRDDIRLTVSGAVYVPGVGYMHPETFKDVAGQNAYDYLLTLPRVVCEYDREDE